nr:GNAT family N-acetyltransferase [Acinetobacter sp. Marseille-Q1620]
MFKNNRLALKPFTEEYLAPILDLFQDHEFMKFSPYGALTYAKALTRFSKIKLHYKNYGFGKMLIIEKI